jgi:hypothetical protein
VAVGSVTCPACGAEHPHRQRPLRAQALAKRRLVVLGLVLLAVVALVALSFAGGGSKRSAQCRAYDDAQARYDHARSAGEDVTPDQLAEVDRLHAACAASER